MQIHMSNGTGQHARVFANSNSLQQPPGQRNKSLRPLIFTAPRRRLAAASLESMLVLVSASPHDTVSQSPSPVAQPHFFRPCFRTPMICMAVGETLLLTSVCRMAWHTETFVGPEGRALPYHLFAISLVRTAKAFCASAGLQHHCCIRCAFKGLGATRQHPSRRRHSWPCLPPTCDWLVVELFSSVTNHGSTWRSSSGFSALAWRTCISLTISRPTAHCTSKPTRHQPGAPLAASREPHTGLDLLRGPQPHPIPRFCHQTTAPTRRASSPSVQLPDTALDYKHGQL